MCSGLFCVLYHLCLCQYKVLIDRVGLFCKEIMTTPDTRLQTPLSALWWSWLDSTGLGWAGHHHWTI